VDPVDKAKQSMGSVERAIFNLPGIEGYREKDMRRDADKQVREALVLRLSEQRRRLNDLQGELLSSGGLLWMDDIERVITRFNTLIDRIHTASYGYAGFFDLQRVKEPELDQLAAFDKSLSEMLPALGAAIDALQKAIAASEGIKEAIQAISDQLGQMSETFGHRAESMQAAA
jgi:hypothetical protein